MATQALLDDLLSKPPQAHNSTPPELLRPSRFALYGAGNLGRDVAGRLCAAGVEPLAFADDTPFKQGSILDGLPVLSPEEVTNRFGPDVTFFVTILNPALRFVEARRRLRQRITGEVQSLLDLGRLFPDFLFPLLQYDRPETILQNAGQIRRAFSILADEQSREQFVAHLEFRVTAKYDALPAKSIPPYFPDDLFGKFSSDAIFVDCGAYDGDTIRGFLSHQEDRFGGIIAFEPDQRNYERLAAYVSHLGPEIGAKIRLHRGAVGSHSGEVAFHETGDMSAAVSSDGTGGVKLFALDEIIPGTRAQMYVKFDIEGFELQALQGATRLLATNRPVLAVSIYHRPADLWEIPLYLHDLDVGYRLRLRTEGDDGMDIVCYALPSDSKS